MSIFTGLVKGVLTNLGSSKVYSNGKVPVADREKAKFECTLITESPAFGTIGITNLVSGMSLYSNMFGNRIFYGFISIYDEINYLKKYLVGTSAYLYIKCNDDEALYKVINIVSQQDKNSGYSLYKLEFVSVMGYYLISQRDIFTDNHFYTGADMIKKALIDDEKVYIDDCKNPQMLKIFEKLYPSKGNSDYSSHLTVCDTVILSNPKYQKFSSRSDQIDFICSFAKPYGNSDITNTINDIWCWQPKPDIIAVESISKLMKQSPTISAVCGGEDKSIFFDKTIKAFNFELKKTPDTMSPEKNMTAVIDMNTRSIVAQVSDVNKIKQKSGKTLNGKSIETNKSNTYKNIVYEVGVNSETNQKIDYYSKSGSHITDMRIDSKIVNLRKDFFKSLQSFYAHISINIGSSIIDVGDIIDLTIRDFDTSSDKDKRLSGKWMVVEKGLHMYEDRSFMCVFGIVKDSTQ